MSKESPLVPVVATAALAVYVYSAYTMTYSGESNKRSRLRCECPH